MKKYHQIFLSLILALSLTGCTKEKVVDLSILAVQYNQVMAIHAEGGDIGEGDYLNSAKIQRFVTNMNYIQTLQTVDESEVPMDSVITLEFQLRSANKKLYLCPPYIGIDGNWFKGDEKSTEYIEIINDLLHENLGN